jgi:hypothetical protein
MRPLVCLATEENESAGDGREKKSDSVGLIPISSCGDGHRHHGAAADQHESHECDQPHVEDFCLNGPVWTQQTHESISGQERSERQGIGKNEEPHAEFDRCSVE